MGYRKEGEAEDRDAGEEGQGDRLNRSTRPSRGELLERMDDDTRLYYFLASQRVVRLFHNEQLLGVFRFCVH
jgi:hypothetical protein